MKYLLPLLVGVSMSLVFGALVWLALMPPTGGCHG